MKRILVIALLSLLCLSISISCVPKSEAASTVDWWSMFRHDAAHVGLSTSAAPATNTLLWSYATGGGIDYGSPAVVNGVVYVSSDDHYLYALNAATGAYIWSYKTGGKIDSSPAVADGIVYIGSEDHKVYALNATTGAKIWTYTTGDQVESSQQSLTASSTSARMTTKSTP